MKITILGSGAAFGTPTIFNDWGNADKTNPKNLRTRASILLEENSKSILIDAGPDFRTQINNNNVKNIDSVLITHGHYDHIGGIPELPRATRLLKHGINVCASLATMEELKRCYWYLFQEKADAEPDSNSLKWNVIPNSGTINIEGLELITAQFPHHHIKSSAFRYKNFAYVTDWQAIPSENSTFLQNLDLLIVECNNGLIVKDNGHSDIYKIKELINTYSPKRVILSHISTNVDDVALIKEMPTNCELSYDGMVIEY